MLNWMSQPKKRLNLSIVGGAMIAIQKIQLPIPGMDVLHEEACREGYDFIETLVAEWASATNRFNAPGEALCGRIDQGLLVAVGGLNCDPFAGRPDMGRIRRVYVRPAWRNQGIGRSLVEALVEHARTHFRSVRLRAENAGAARLYERIGFTPLESPDATHILVFDK
ncbi:MAG TPA: GNAT family N-acetyltransferase [Acidobacteriaceae bacterium]|nr:GNAT family N-acetyltransferase [Acidobacteriaceae bacterium]